MQGRSNGSRVAEPPLTTGLMSYQTWCDKFSWRLCYRSTASNQLDNVWLLQLLCEAASSLSQQSHVLIMGDLNYPEINYRNYEVEAPHDSETTRFL